MNHLKIETLAVCFMIGVFLFSDANAHPDSYEPDNSPETANVLMLNSQSNHDLPGYVWYQTHNFYENEDIDWLKFYGSSDMYYRITVYINTTVQGMNPVNGTNCDPVIKLYGTDWTTPLEYKNDHVLGQTEVLEWHCPSAGMYYLEITQCSLIEPGCQALYGEGTEYNIELIQRFQPYDSIIYGKINPKTALVTTSAGIGAATEPSTGIFFLGHLPGSYTLWVSSPGYVTYQIPITVSEAVPLNINETLLDINGDCLTDLKDVIIALKILAGIPGFVRSNCNYADVNGDSKVGYQEILFLLNKLSNS